MLLDTGQGVPGYLPLLEQAVTGTLHAEGLQEIVLTHAHVDHIGGVAGIQERFGALSVTKKPWPELDGSVSIVAIDEGDELHTEGVTLRAIWTPGHARDHLCYYLLEEKALFTGDVVLGAGTTVIPEDGDLGDYLHSLRRLLDLDLEVIYPAHGPMIREPRQKIEAYLAHRALRDRQILEGVRTGVRTIPELVQRIYTDVPTFLHGAAGMSVHAHLRKLEGEGLVRREEEQWVAG
jgi:glyoxylase-like metal-dependent hydrolase (beta-lactamase superfamily II)